MRYKEYKNYLLYKERDFPLLVKKIGKFNPKSILEIGCGNGRNIRALVKAMPYIEYTGVDISKVGIQEAKMKGGGKYILTSADDLPFDNNSFDVIFSVHALEQMKYIISDVVKEMYRVCVKGIVLFEPFFHFQNIFGKIHNIQFEYVQGVPTYVEKYGFVICEHRALKTGRFVNRTGLLVAVKNEKES